jgi:hypothetical protein
MLKIDDFVPFNFFSSLYASLRPYFTTLLKKAFTVAFEKTDS